MFHRKKSKQIKNSTKIKESFMMAEPPSNLTDLPSLLPDKESTENVPTEPPLFPPTKPGKKPDYGTNNTLELLEQIPSKVVELKLDDVLTAVKEVDNLCDFGRCKTKTSLMGQTCEYCQKRFCFKHGLPEVHGCGEAAKKNERKQFLHPKPAKTIKQEEELVKAKKKLQSKLKDMQVGRMQKTGGGAEGAGSSKGAAGSKKKKGK